MKFVNFLKVQNNGWKNYEILALSPVIILILYNAFFLNDSIIAVISSICGILYTVIAGKGKISCYYFGLAGSGCYIYLSLTNALWGNALLYLLYYIPMQILGFFQWKKHLKIESKEIIKTSLSNKQRLKFLFISIIGCFTISVILQNLNDTNPIIDGITTFLSILAMYFTVKRLIEQWFIWIIVNGLSFIMWLNIIINGTRAYSTLVMWAVYFILGIYFYIDWKKELQ